LNVQIVPVLEVRELERREATVKAFIDTDDFNPYMEDAQVGYNHISIIP